MRAVLRTGVLFATYYDGEWTCADAAWQARLNAYLPTALETEQYDPYPVRTIAERTAARFGWTVVRIDPPPPHNPNVIY